MTLSQVRALCRGLADLDRAEEAHKIHILRLAVWGEADDIEKHLDQLKPVGPDPIDAILAQFSGEENGE